MLTSSLNNAWAPVVYRTDPLHRGAVLERTGRDIAALTALAAGFVAFAAPTAAADRGAPRRTTPRPMTPAVGLVAIGSLLSVLYLANVHLVFAVGAQRRPGARHPDCPARGCRGRLGRRQRRLSLAAIGVGMTVTYAAMAAGVARAGPPRQPDPLARVTARRPRSPVGHRALPGRRGTPRRRSLAGAALGRRRGLLAVLSLLVLRRVLTR